MSVAVGSRITCLVCHGSGYTVSKSPYGQPQPVICKGCAGSGKQAVRAQ